MRITRLRFPTGVILSAVLLAQSAAADRVASNAEASSTVVVRDVRPTSTAVSGVLVNNSHRVLRDVRLLVRHAWLWRDERHPGQDNPGRADYYIVESVPAGGSAQFTYAYSPSLPNRSDGHFVTTVEMVSFTEEGF